MKSSHWDYGIRLLFSFQSAHMQYFSHFYKCLTHKKLQPQWNKLIKQRIDEQIVFWHSATRSQTTNLTHKFFTLPCSQIFCQQKYPSLCTYDRWVTDESLTIWYRTSTTAVRGIGTLRERVMWRCTTPNIRINWSRKDTIVISTCPLVCKNTN